MPAIQDNNSSVRYLANAREYFDNFKNTHISDYLEKMRGFRIHPNNGYPFFNGSDVVSQTMIDICGAFRDTYETTDIPGKFSSPRALVNSWLIFRKQLQERGESFEEIRNELLEKSGTSEVELIDQYSWLPEPFVQFDHVRREVIDVLDHILEMDEVKQVMGLSSEEKKESGNIVQQVNVDPHQNTSLKGSTSLFKRLWHDPVWSKLIAVSLAALFWIVLGEDISRYIKHKLLNDSSAHNLSAPHENLPDSIKTATSQSVKVIPNAALTQPTIEKVSENSSANNTPLVALPITKSSALPIIRQHDPTVLRSQIVLAAQIYGTDPRNEEYKKIINRALIDNELDLAISVADKLYGTDVKNDCYDKIIHHAISLKKFDLAGQVASKIYGTDRRNGALKLLLEATEARAIEQTGNKMADVSAVTPNSASFDLVLYKKVYGFANSVTGMNMLASNAKAFTETWIAKCKDQNLETYKEYFLYANSLSGMNLLARDAQAWADSKFQCLQKQ